MVMIDVRIESFLYTIAYVDSGIEREIGQKLCKAISTYFRPSIYSGVASYDAIF